MFLASFGSPTPNMASGGVSLERRSRCHIRSLVRAPPLSNMMTAQRKPQLDVRGFRLESSEKYVFLCYLWLKTMYLIHSVA